MAFLLGLDTPPMEARSVAELPEDPGWQFEPKWDGFRCLAFKSGAGVDLRAKSGKPLGRYFPEMLAALQAAVANFVLDGELTIVREGTLSFEALQDRLHPADSRIRKLAAATPAQLILFDCLATESTGPILDRPLTERRAALDAIVPQLRQPAHFHLTPFTLDRDEAQAWLDHPRQDIDGVVAKRLDGPYEPGQRAMRKIKPLRTADCVVGGFRYGSNTNLVGSLLLGLYNETGLLDHVGFTSAIAERDRPKLTTQLQALIEPPGFTGESPGGPSRWNTERTAEWQPLRPVLVVEVRYDHVIGHRFRRGATIVRWRPDKAPAQCQMGQLCDRVTTRRPILGVF